MKKYWKWATVVLLFCGLLYYVLDVTFQGLQDTRPVALTAATRWGLSEAAIESAAALTPNTAIALSCGFTEHLRYRVTGSRNGEDVTVTVCCNAAAECRVAE